MRLVSFLASAPRCFSPEGAISGATQTHAGEFRKIAERPYTNSANKIYYAVFKVSGKRIWKSLDTADRELANRKVNEELGKRGKIDPKADKMSLGELLRLYEESIKGLAGHTQTTRKSILKNFKETWKHGLEIAVRDVTEGQLQLGLSGH